MGVRALVVVVGLGQPPDVVVAGVVVVRLAGADLVVQRPGPLVPHPLQEVQPEPGLAGEVRAGRSRAGGSRAGGCRARPGAHLRRAHLIWERGDALQQDGLGVAGRLHEVQVVPGVEPAAGRVDPHPGRVLGQAALEVAVLVNRRAAVGHRAEVVEVAGRAAQRGVDEVRAVPLVLVEVERVGQWPRVKLRGRADREPRRGRGRVAQDPDPVPARRPDAGEPGRPYPAVALAPRAQILAGLPGGGDRAGPGPDHDPVQATTGKTARGPGFRHDLGQLGRAGRVADLVHPDRRGRRAGRRAVRPGGQHGPRRGLGADLRDLRSRGRGAAHRRRGGPGGGTGRPGGCPGGGTGRPGCCPGGGAGRPGGPAERRRQAERHRARPGPGRPPPVSSSACPPTPKIHRPRLGPRWLRPQWASKGCYR